jgi:hypothetical protein
MTYTKEELQEMIDKMKTASRLFYSLAQGTGVHQFIEFTGFMNEYIKICEQALAKGIDFTETSTHTGTPLPMHDYEAAYIGEKFGCIFETAFNNDPALKEAFMSSAFGAP